MPQKSVLIPFKSLKFLSEKVFKKIKIPFKQDAIIRHYMRLIITNLSSKELSNKRSFIWAMSQKAKEMSHSPPCSLPNYRGKWEVNQFESLNITWISFRIMPFHVVASSISQPLRNGDSSIKLSQHAYSAHHMCLLLRMYWSDLICSSTASAHGEAPFLLCPIHFPLQVVSSTFPHKDC